MNIILFITMVNQQTHPMTSSATTRSQGDLGSPCGRLSLCHGRGLAVEKNVTLVEICRNTLVILWDLMGFYLD